MRSIELTRGQQAIVDDDDYEKLSKYKWFANRSRGKGRTNWYASRQYRHKILKDKHGHGKQIMVAMHREILTPPEGKSIDHINGNALDNRKTNLRVCTNQQNLWNAKWLATPNKPYKGVSKYRSKSHPGWVACIGYCKIHICLGWFKSAEVAARTYDKLAKILYGEFARLNFPDS